MHGIHSEFAKERERIERRKVFLQLRQSQAIDRQTEAYSDWLARAGEPSASYLSIQFLICLLEFDYINM